MAISLWGTAWTAESDYKSGTPWPNIDLEGKARINQDIYSIFE